MITSNHHFIKERLPKRHRKVSPWLPKIFNLRLGIEMYPGADGQNEKAWIVHLWQPELETYNPIGIVYQGSIFYPEDAALPLNDSAISGNKWKGIVFAPHDRLYFAAAVTYNDVVEKIVLLHILEYHSSGGLQAIRRILETQP